MTVSDKLQYWHCSVQFLSWKFEGGFLPVLTKVEEEKEKQNSTYHKLPEFNLASEDLHRKQIPICFIVNMYLNLVVVNCFHR